MLKPDPYSGDYGPNFFGHAWNTATYLVNHLEYGWIAFGGNVKVRDGVVTVTPRDSSRQRIFVASLGLWLTLDAGTFDSLEFDPNTGIVRVGLSKSNESTSAGRLRIEQPTKVSGMGTYLPKSTLKLERGSYVVPLGTGTTWVQLAVSH
jgi:hypothetical protein